MDQLVRAAAGTHPASMLPFVDVLNNTKAVKPPPAAEDENDPLAEFQFRSVDVPRPTVDLTDPELDLTVEQEVDHVPAPSKKGAPIHARARTAWFKARDDDQLTEQMAVDYIWNTTAFKGESRKKLKEPEAQFHPYGAYRSRCSS